MIVIRCNMLLNKAGYEEICRTLTKQAKQGLILLSPGFELLNEVPNDGEIVVIAKKEEGRNG